MLASAYHPRQFQQWMRFGKSTPELVQLVDKCNSQSLSPTLIIGPVGSGKTSLAECCIRSWYRLDSRVPLKESTQDKRWFWSQCIADRSPVTFLDALNVFCNYHRRLERTVVKPGTNGLHQQQPQQHSHAIVVIDHADYLTQECHVAIDFLATRSSNVHFICLFEGRHHIQSGLFESWQVIELHLPDVAERLHVVQSVCHDLKLDLAVLQPMMKHCAETATDIRQVFCLLQPFLASVDCGQNALKCNQLGHALVEQLCQLLCQLPDRLADTLRVCDECVAQGIPACDLFTDLVGLLLNKQKLVLLREALQYQRDVECCAGMPDILALHTFVLHVATAPR